MASGGPSHDGQDSGASAVSRKTSGPENVASPFSLTGVQQMVKVGSSDDPAEHEANHVAEKVASGSSSARPSIARMESMQRKSTEATGDGEHVAQRKEKDHPPPQTQRPSGTASIYFKRFDLSQSPAENELNHSVRRRTDTAASSAGDLDAAAARAIATKDAGAPLRPHVQQKLESLMGANLSSVRVHEGPEAQESAATLQARAFTHQRDIWLGKGESQDDTNLMAHEATHVVQQGAAMPEAAAGTTGPTPGSEPVTTGAAAPAAPGGAPGIPAQPTGEPSASVPGATGSASGAKAASPASAPAKPAMTPGAAGPGLAAKPGEGPTPERPAPAAPNPRQAIASTIGAVKQRAKGAGVHPPASTPVSAAEASGTEPGREAARAADQQTVANISTATQQSDQVTPTFKSKLKDTLKKSMDSTKTPKTKDEADEVMKDGAKRASQSLGTQMASGRDAAAGPVQQAVDHPVQAEAAGPAPELKTEQAGPPPQPIPATSATPAPLPPEQLDMSSDRDSTDQAMAKADVSKEQLEEGNDPAFGPTISARDQAEKHEASVEPRYRASEVAEHVHAQGAARQELALGLGGIHDARTQQIAKVSGQQVDTKDKNLAAKNDVTKSIGDIKDQTLRNVEQTLAGLEEKATQMFEDGVQRAEAVYNDAFSEAKGGTWTWLTTWGDDWSEHIESALRTAKASYSDEMERAIDQVANFVEERLTTAKKCVADGLHQVETFVAGLGSDVKEFGKAALQEVSGDFEKMVSDIDSRADGLIDKLTEQYPGILSTHAGDGGKASRRKQVAMAARLRRHRRLDRENPRLQGHASRYPRTCGISDRRYHQASDQIPWPPDRRSLAWCQ